ncbi:L-fucose permease [Fusarium mundagurra]|uniref:L-fucose permease n=1 Tax=Fusarium mundagurra TaxID=1567541 RepID=A0A8H5YV39_9HYPO|nr:L-fucose permease [Fusarium mundagurra]
MRSRQPDLWAAEYITFAGATIFLILRIVSRRITRIQFWWDDYFSCASYVTAVAWGTVVPICTTSPLLSSTSTIADFSQGIHHGLGLHAKDVKGKTLTEANYTTKKYLFIMEHFYAWTLFFAKISILSFYWRMFRVANIQIFVSVLLVCSVLWLLVREFLTTFHCYPVRAFWDPNVEHFNCPIKSGDFFFGTVLAHVLIDVGILILPIVQIQKLQLPILQKIAIIFMFMFGILVCVAGLVIVSVSASFDNKSVDITWELAPVIIWASVEVNLVTVSACLPIIRPACLYLFTCTNPISSIRSGSNNFGSNYGSNYGRSQTKHSIRLGTIGKDESSSTHELARSDPSGSESFNSEFEHEDQRHGNIATVTGPSSTANLEHPAGVGGIMVKNETVVHVSRARSSR